MMKHLKKQKKNVFLPNTDELMKVKFWAREQGRKRLKISFPFNISKDTINCQELSELKLLHEDAYVIEILLTVTQLICKRCRVNLA